MGLVDLKGVTKTYETKDGSIEAVKDFNLEIEENEFIVLVGPSGCGKTTTLRMVAGLEEITGGEIYIDGKLVNNMMPKERDIAMVFQNYALYPHMSVYNNMAFGLRLHKFPGAEIKKKILEALYNLQIEHLSERWPKALSGGQKQRVALGRAIVKHPKVFLMDEPLSNLDAKLRAQMRLEIIRLYRRLNATVIYVTHDQVEAMTMGSRIVVMDNGIIQQVDKPDIIYNKPANVFVGGFFGTPSMNFIKAAIEYENDDIYFRIIETKEVRARDLVKKVGIEKDLKVPCNRKKEILDSDYIGKQVTLGLRPEHIYIDREMLEKYSDSTICAEVDIVEPLGMEKLLHANFGKDIALTVKVRNNANIKKGESVFLAIDTDKVHVFDRKTGKVLFNGN